MQLDEHAPESAADRADALRDARRALEAAQLGNAAPDAARPAAAASGTPRSVSFQLPALA